MEINCNRSKVVTESTFLRENCEVPIDVDFTLPDYCPDISKIFKCRAIARISSKSINGRNVTADGSVTITVLYCDPDGLLRSYEYQYPFSKSIELSSECDSACFRCTARCEHINCRAVNERKIDIHGAVNVLFNISCKKSDEVVSDIKDKEIEHRNSSISASMPVGYAEKYIAIEEELEVGENSDINILLKYDADSCISECKIISGKLILKGDLYITASYCSEGSNEIKMFKTSVPFSQVLDMDGLTENCRCDPTSEIAYIDLKPHISGDGTAHSLLLSAKLLLSGRAFCDCELSVITDAFSRKMVADIKKERLCVNKIVKKITENYDCKKSIDISTDGIVDILDLWCAVKSYNTAFKEGRLIIEGILTVCAVARDNDNSIGYFEKSIDFEYNDQITTSGGSIVCEPIIKLNGCNYSLNSSNSLDVNIQLVINATVSECIKFDAVKDIDVSNDKIKVNDNCAMKIYFASEGEKIWNIARRYNASVNEIQSINNMECETINEARMILIPMI